MVLKVIEATFPEPIRLPVKPGTKLYPGSIVKLVEYDGTIVADKCDGYLPFGINYTKSFGNKDIDMSIIASIYPQRMVADVGRFDKKTKYSTGDSLYCNKLGILSNKKAFETSVVLAKVITPPGVRNKYMQILWL